MLVRFLTGARDFSLLENVQSGSGPHPASYSMGKPVRAYLLRESGEDVKLTEVLDE
jgi:hypothetical protein